ncbi:MAG: hypothetical protein HN686_16320, partial [Bacteroidetes bacterium]|nr:hypothetical protein [Bacteroidota bacterium]
MTLKAIKAGTKKQVMYVYYSIASIIIAILFYFLLPIDPSEFKIVTHEVQQVGDELNLYVSDLDEDGRFEQIQYYKSFPSSPLIIVTREGLVVSQIQIPGEAIDRFNLQFHDYNENGQKEVILFTQRNDSLWCHFYEPLSNHPHITSAFIDTLVTIDGKVDISIHSLGPRKLTPEGFDNYYFSISAGFSIYPRKIYSYNLNKDSLLCSHPSCTALINPHDISPQGYWKRYIFGQSYSYKNCPNDEIFSDSLLWMYVYREDLTLAFNPINIDRQWAAASTVAISVDNTVFFYTTSHNLKNSNTSGRIWKIDQQGQIVDSISIPIGGNMKVSSHVVYQGNRAQEIAIVTSGGQLYYTDLDLTRLRNKSIPILAGIDRDMHSDLDQDGIHERLYFSGDGTQLLVFSNHMKHETTAPLISESNEFVFSQSLEDEKLINHLQSGNRYYSFSYQQNNARWLLILGVIGIFILVFSLFYFSSLMLQQIERKREKVKMQIQELQLTNLSNHANPHFTFNMLNAIASIGYDDREK